MTSLPPPPEPGGLSGAFHRAHLSIDTRLALLENSSAAISEQLGKIANSQNLIALEIAEGRRDAKRVQLLITLLVLGALGFGVYKSEMKPPGQAAPGQHVSQAAASLLGPLAEE